MTIAAWQPGEIYIPGSLVLPSTVPGATVTAIPNADFEGGDSGWTKGTGWAINTNLAFAGTYSAAYTGVGAASIISSTKHAVSPGKAITATCFIHQGAAADGIASAAVTLTWYTAADAVISISSGNSVSTGAVGIWRKSTLSATAPPTAAKVAIGCEASSDGTALNADGFAWNYVTGAAATGLAYKAVQTEAGSSGAQEPTWPTTVGNTVVDNEVTWEAVTTGSVTWEASSVLTSGSTEPTWPTENGAYVSDNNIAWETVPLRITDENCPHSRVVAIAASKVFAGDTDVVRFCATLNARDWSSTDDAGFLPTGLQQKSQVGVEAMGVYRGNLAVWSGSTFQVWQVDPDPAAMALLDAMEGIGSMHHQAVQPVADDLFFLAALGVRTVGIAAGTNNLATGDVGKAIDELVKPEADSVDVEPIATYYPGAGQYWLAFRPRTEEGEVVPDPSPPPDPDPPEEFVDYEYILLMTSQNYMARLVGVDYVAQEYTDFGSLYCGGEVSIGSDGEFLFRSEGADDFYQYSWRGTCFSQVAYQNDTGNTVQSIDIVGGLGNRFLCTGMGSGGDGLRVKTYGTEAPFTLATDYDKTTVGDDHWTGLFDLRHGDTVGTPVLGDAIVMIPFANEMLTLFSNNAGALVFENELSVGNVGNSNTFHCHRDSGYIAIQYFNSTTISLYLANAETSGLSFIGDLTASAQVRAVAVIENDIIVTAEEYNATNDIVRTYSRDELVLTLLDEFILDGKAPTASHFRTSPYSNKLWLMTTNTSAGVVSFDIASDGTITELVKLAYGVGTSGYGGSFVSFLKEPMVVTTNGFEGIKAKLYECWEMNETGSITRVGSMGNVDLPVVLGTVTDRAGVIGNAADFSTSALSVACTSELHTVSTFSVCLDVCVDTKTDLRWIMMRGRDSWHSSTPETEDFALYYNDANDRFYFLARLNDTVYSVNAADLGAITPGQFYHLYIEYNKSENKIKIRAENGILYETALPVHSDLNHYSLAKLTFGRRSTTVSLAEYMDGGVDQVFWFWDALSSTQQEWMYNSGNSRAFSEL